MNADQFADRRAVAAPKSALRTRWKIAAYAVFAVILFVSFLAASFPYDQTVSTLISPLGLRLEYHGQRMSVPFGARLENVKLVSIAGQPGRVLFESSGVTLTPTLRSLLLGKAGVRLAADFFGGNLKATIVRHSSITESDFEFDGVNLEMVQPIKDLGAAAVGRLSAIGSMEMTNPDVLASDGHLTMKGSAVALAIINGLPPINIGRISGDAALTDSVLTLKNFMSEGADLSARARGEIHLAGDLSESTIDLTFAISTTASGRHKFGVFLKMLPHPPEEGPFYLRGSVSAPSLS